MSVEHKIILVRIGAAIALALCCYASWWLDYRYVPKKLKGKAKPVRTRGC